MLNDREWFTCQVKKNDGEIADAWTDSKNAGKEISPNYQGTVNIIFKDPTLVPHQKIYSFRSQNVFAFSHDESTSNRSDFSALPTQSPDSTADIMNILNLDFGCSDSHHKENIHPKRRVGKHGSAVRYIAQKVAIGAAVSGINSAMAEATVTDASEIEESSDVLSEAGDLVIGLIGGILGIFSG